MANGMSRRGVAAAGIGAGLAAAGLAADASAGKGNKKKPKDIVHAGAHDTVTVERNRVTVPRVRYVTHVHHDGSSEIVNDHGKLVPRDGTSVDYHVSGTHVRETTRGEEAETVVLAVFRATGGSYDPATGQLVLDGEVIASSPDVASAGRLVGVLWPLVGAAMVGYVDPGFFS